MLRLEERRKYSPAKTAPGHPGLSPTWAAADKDFTTTALGSDSLIWATVAHGMLSEVYYPTIGRPQLRDVSFSLFVIGDSSTSKLSANTPVQRHPRMSRCPRLFTAVNCQATP